MELLLLVGWLREVGRIVSDNWVPFCIVARIEMVARAEEEGPKHQPLTTKG